MYKIFVTLAIFAAVVAGLDWCVDQNRFGSSTDVQACVDFIEGTVCSPDSACADGYVGQWTYETVQNCTAIVNSQSATNCYGKTAGYWCWCTGFYGCFPQIRVC